MTDFDQVWSDTSLETPVKTPVELIWGARAIAAAIGRGEKATFALLENGHLPFAKRIGGRWCASKSALRDFFGA
jgi:hypothetical protein